MEAKPIAADATMADAEVKEEANVEEAATEVKEEAAAPVGGMEIDAKVPEAAAGGEGKPAFMDVASMEAEMAAVVAAHVPSSPTILLRGKNTKEEKASSTNMSTCVECVPIHLHLWNIHMCS